jgi:tetratricopeptide (TPR) repeat protein
MAIAKGMLAAAFACCMLGCAASPTVAQRALVLIEHDQVDAAFVLVERHLEQHPADPEALKLFIRLLGKRRDLDRAREQAERLARLLPPGSSEPWIELGYACELAHRYDAALEMYDYAAAVAPNDAAGPKQGGVRALRWGEVEAALPRLEESTRRDPSDPESWHALGLVQLKLGRLSEARAAYTSGVRADPDALENRLGLATVALQEQRPSAALEQYDALIAVRPEFADAYLGRSWSLILLGRWSEAEAALTRAEAAGAEQSVVARQRRALAGLRRAETPGPAPE